MPIPEPCPPPSLSLLPSLQSSSPSPPSSEPCGATWSASEVRTLLDHLADGQPLVERVVATERGRPTAGLAADAHDGLVLALVSLRDLLRALNLPPR
jgi:hypothetical protein